MFVYLTIQCSSCSLFGFFLFVGSLFSKLSRKLWRRPVLVGVGAAVRLVAWVSAVVLLCAQHSRNVIALRMSDCTVCQKLRGDLNFHPYKMVMVQAMNDQDIVNRKTLCEFLLNTG